MADISRDKKLERPTLTPARNRLLVKFHSLEDSLQILKPGIQKGWRQDVWTACFANLQRAKDRLSRLVFSTHITWSYLHRVDEDLLLLVPFEQLNGRATDIRSSFELNIREKTVRTLWIGDKGRLLQAIDLLNSKDNQQKDLEIRHTLREALRIVNEQVDRGFWKLSMNTVVTVLSGILLGATMVLFIFPKVFGMDWFQYFSGDTTWKTFSLLVLLGIAGSYLSNLLTRSDFLFVRGGPFWIFMVYHLIVRPLLGAFAAVLIFVIEKTKLLFSIVPTGEKGISPLLTVNATSTQQAYMYFLLAVVSGFAAEKILRMMIDRILKRLEQQAEKTKESEAQGEAS